MLQVQAKHNVYDAVNDCIIDLLEQGIVPWHTSWTEGGIPSNLLTNRPYRAINVLMLAAYEYDQNYFLTERQIERLGGFVYKGEKPHLVIDGIGFRSLCPYEVYNIQQVGNISNSLIPKQYKRRSPVSICKEVIERMDHCPRLIHGEFSPVYDLEEDIITMPSMRYYACVEEYFDELFRQLVVGTKHPMRLNKADYSLLDRFHLEVTEANRLVSEIGAWYLRSYTGIEIKHQRDDNFIRYWIDTFNKNPCLAFEVSEMAQKAVEFILGEPYDREEAIDYVEDEMLPF